MNINATDIKSGQFQALQNANEASSKTVEGKFGATEYFEFRVLNLGSKILAYEKNGEKHYVENNAECYISFTGFGYANIAHVIKGDRFNLAVNKVDNKWSYDVGMIEDHSENYSQVKGGDAPMQNDTTQGRNPLYWDTQERITLGQCLNLAVDSIPSRYQAETYENENEWVKRVGELRDKLYLNQQEAMKKMPVTLEDPNEEDDDALPF